jgi:hypothetical protein
MPVSNEDELTRLLQAVHDSDLADTPADNETLAEKLQLPLDSIGSHLKDAKSRSLVWGWRSGRHPGPWYSELELTVQGRRFLAAQQPSPDGASPSGHAW